MVDRQLTEAHHIARHNSHQWLECLETLMHARNSLLNATGDRCFIKHDLEQIELLKSAARDLGKYIGIASKNRDKANAEMERINAILYPKKPPITDAEFAELGERMAANSKAAISNIEGSALLAELSHIDHANIDKHGCCGREPDVEGICFGIGKCPRVAEIAACERFTSDYLAWLEQINEQTGLAAVAARLCVESPVIESELSNV